MKVVEKAATLMSVVVFATSPDVVTGRVGGEKKVSSWKPTNYCKKSVFYGIDYKSTAMIDASAEQPGYYDFSFVLKNKLDDEKPIGTARGQVVYDASDPVHTTTGCYLFDDADGIGKGEVCWKDMVVDADGIKNPKHTFGGDSEWAIVGGHGDFRCATGWLDQLDETISFSEDGTYDVSEITWKVTMYTCGVCEKV